MSGNVYFSPEKFGLTVVGEIEFSDGYYEFDLLALWRRSDGSLVWASDSGCSCPVPFASIGIDDLSTGSLAEFQAEAESRECDVAEQDRIRCDIVDLLIRATLIRGLR